MIDSMIMLAALTVLSGYYVAQCAWRLWRRKPGKYASVLGESIPPIAITLVILTTPAPADALHTGAKVFVIAAVAAATVLRLIARHRYAVHDL